MSACGRYFSYFLITSFFMVSPLTGALAAVPSVESQLLPAVPALDWCVRSRGAYARPLLEEMRRHGLWVVCLSPFQEINWIIPAELRNREVKVCEMVTAIARYRGLDVSWWEGPRETIAVIGSKADEHEINVISKDLASSDASRRSRAIWQAGWMEDARIIPLLVAAGQKADPWQARQVRKSLGRLGWCAVLALCEDQALVSINRELANPVDERSLNSVIAALAQTSSPQAPPMIQKLLDQGINKPLPAVGRIKSDQASALIQRYMEKKPSERPPEGPEILPKLRQSLADPDVMVRRKVLEALGEIGGPEAEKIIQQAGDLSAPKQQAALQEDIAEALVLAGHDMRGMPPKEAALMGLGFWRSLEYSQAIALVNTLTATASRNECWAALDALKDLPGPRVKDLLADLATDPGAKVRYTALMYLGHRDGYQTLAILKKVLSPAHTEVSEGAAMVLADVADQDSLPLIVPLLSNANEAIRQNAVVALQALPEAQALPYLASALKDRSDRVQDMAIDVLSCVGDSQSAALLENIDLRWRWHWTGKSVPRAMVSLDQEAGGRLLKKVLAVDRNSGDEIIRTLISEPLFFPKNLELLEKAGQDPETAVRLRVTSAVSRFSRPTTVAFVEFLEKKLEDPDQTVQAEAAQGLCSQAPPRALAALAKLLQEQHNLALASQIISFLPEKLSVPFLQETWEKLTPNDRRNLVRGFRENKNYAASLMLEKALNLDPANLIQAVESDNLAETKALLEKGANVNTWHRIASGVEQYAGGSVLIESARKGFLDMTKLLVENQADLEARDGQFHMTALAHALSQGQCDVANYLINAGANVNIPVPLVIKQAGVISTWPLEPALTYSLRQGYAASACLMLQHGAKAESRSLGTAPGHEFNVCRRLGNTELINLLLQKGADIKTLNGNEQDALMAACDAGRAGGGCAFAGERRSGRFY